MNNSLQDGSEGDHRTSYGLPDQKHHLIFFLWRFVKDQVYRTQVYDFAVLQERIYANVNNATPQVFHNTWDEIEYRLDIFHATNGSHVVVFGT